MIRLEIGILGSRWWWRHGLIHRLNGPAYMDNTGYQDWLWEGKVVSEFEHMFLREQFLTEPANVKKSRLP